MGFFDFLKKQPSRKACDSSQYIVLDIETTGYSHNKDKIIEIAANKYINGQLCDTYQTYINPGCPIKPYITQLTGITNATVASAPTIQQIKKAFISFIGTTPLVGHNIRTFDIPWLRAQLDTDIRNPLIDTRTLSRHAFPGLPDYSLKFLNQALHLCDLEHHRAANDILITEALYRACQAPEKYQRYLKDKEALAKIPTKSKSPMFHSIDIHAFTPTDPTKIPNTPITGRNIVFSGSFSVTRESLMQIAVDAGAVLKTSVSRKVDYLVIGQQDARFADENGMTGKLRTAISLNESKQANIQVINEETFLELSAQTITL